ncbi:endoplasmic reticulum metallopeptidase 1-like [Lineus longissimus]|uniref:endoplasmic reticulum metallopeptidase 1-like n=1 Tax=Lineus longissimus TaxID=88925 RepID=UPI00315D6E29
MLILLPIKMASTVRHRPNLPKHDDGLSAQNESNDSKKATKDSALVREYMWIVIFAFFAMLFCIVHHENGKLPEPLDLRSAKPGMFVAERAYQDLLAITKWGKRIVGSPANEKNTVKYLMDQIADIQKKAQSVHWIESDLQTVSGTFTLQFLGEFSSYYDLVKNVVVRFGPKTGAEHALLVSCHFDSIVGSPGASDDAVSCALMLEALRILSQDERPFKYNIVFNFNGAEENILQASHGFITKHKWAKNIRAFVNLDSAGSGGRELVFQTGPENPWLVKAYAEAAVYPYASIVGQEIFQSGFIPSDTDFRIYRDFGNIPGIDIAYINNGYVYHTEFDTADRIPKGCLQRGGENLLALVKRLASSPKLEDPKNEAKGNMVFYDILGKFLIMYPDRVGRFVNYITAIIVFIGIAKKTAGFRTNGLTGTTYLSNLVKAVVVMFIAWIATLLGVVLVALLLIAMGRRMSWYTHTFNVIGLYIIPAVMANLTVHIVAKKYLYKRFGNMWHIEGLYFDANLVIMATIMTVMTYAEIGSAFLVLLLVLLPLMIKDRGVKIWGLRYQDARVMYIVIHLLSQAFPSLAISYLIYNVYVLFVPLMGRVGTEINTDIFIGLVNAGVVIIHMSYQSSVVYVTRSMKRTLLCLGSIFLATFIVVLFTPLGFPYRYDLAGPTTQRHVVSHIERHFYNKEGEVTKTDSGMWFIPFDAVGTEALIPYLKELEGAKPHECDGPYCGMPYLLPMLTMMRKTWYVPGPKLTIPPEKRVIVKLTDRKFLEGNKQLLKLAVTGPDHIGIVFEVREGVNITKWSIGNGHPHPTKVPAEIKRDTYWVYYSYGTKPSKPWEFWVELQTTSSSKDEPVMEISFSGQFLHGEYEVTDFHKTFEDRIPKWVSPLFWSSTYDVYTY